MNKFDNLLINKDLPFGATELSPDDLEGLIPSYITTRNDLNEFEKTNITNAISWLRRKNLKYQFLLTMELFFELHSKMFDKTWTWAGTLRQNPVNIGNTPIDQIQIRVKNVLDNVRYWIEQKSFVVDEICIRFHHQIVWIHPFSNGNGRFSRIICDELRRSLGGESFTWGNSADNLISSSHGRTDYMAALRTADKKDYSRLIAFAKSK